MMSSISRDFCFQRSLKKFKFSDIKKLKRANTWIAYFSSECTDEERKVIAMTNPAIKEALNYEMLFSQDEVKRREYELVKIDC